LGETTDEMKTVQVSDDLPTPAPTEASESLLLPGTVVDRYILVEHLGSGGLGDVYKAYDPELDRRIAIKILRSAVVQRETALGLPRDRLQREAQALAKLHHPNVVSVHDVGEFHDELFIAMGFADGLPLHRWAQTHKPDWNRVRDVFLDAGRGLAAAHAAGLVHRDFKPANVVVSPDDHVVVLDFGLARAATVALDQPAELAMPDGDSSLLRREVTGQEVLLGTPAYMAPELFRQVAASQASDQFAFCVAMYRVLFGAFPFQRDSVAEYVLAVEKGELEVPTGPVPRWLVRVLTRGMQGKPDQRYPDIQALLGDLEGDRTRRKRRLLGLALAVPLLGVAVGAGAWLFRPEPTAEELAVSDKMAIAAREAAARGDFVYPPEGDPKAPTALSSVLELEALSGPAAPRALQTASELRTEFAGALIKFGDRYYDMEGGRPFAADFYAMALVFDPDDSHAAQRAHTSPSQREAVIERARSGSFTGPELAAGAVLAALTEEEPAKRSKKLRKYLANDAPTGLTTRAALEALVEDTTKPKVARTTPARVPAAAVANPFEPEEVIELDAEDDPPATGTKTAGASGPTPSVSQPKRAAAEVKLGNAELGKGRFAAAASHYHRALEFDRGSFGALMGLSRAKFELGQYAKSVRFAERATRVRPRSASAFQQLGDAQFKTLNYAAARKAYQRAKSLGSKKAQAGLDRLSNRLGSE
jgi:Tfp pilus assembly protein PilF/predicted Ser/Thr protein kinase